MRWRVFPSRRRLMTYFTLYLCFALLMTFGGCADRLILFPSKQRMPVPGGARIEVADGNGRTLEIWTALTPGCVGREPEAFVLDFIGKDRKSVV